MAKTKTPAKPKPRTKAAKITALKRVAGAKARHHRRRTKKLALLHLVIFGVLIFGIGATSGVVIARADNLIPPAGSEIDIVAYERVAKANKPADVKAPDQVGSASWYALGLSEPDALTCASTKFPRGTYLEVTDLRNGAKMVCLVNDYGPASWTGRVIDLSRGSYRQLEGLGSGTLPAEIRVVSHP